ncbi:putative uncharacterized protein [Streptomyces azureus]|uniref:Uncharacterized protein n=1 Tax=Streptomyces azureus TaxID=146537 RepID=A0A0K8PPA4_STRAJ|nr:putative uncharacterized protein [Streptomyces azureus]
MEVAHPVPRHQSLVADALVHLPYSNLPHVFVEVDRASMTFGKLTAKLTAYDEYRTNVWKSTGKQEWLAAPCTTRASANPAHPAPTSAAASTTPATRPDARWHGCLRPAGLISRVVCTRVWEAPGSTVA